MPSARVNAFLEQVQLAQLLEPAQLQQARQLPQANADDPLPLAKELVTRSWLTPYQAKLAIQGKGNELLRGQYRVLDLLGEGGMGQVYRAAHLAMGRVVALKVIKAEHLDNPAAVQRFYQEIRAAAQLTHANIVTAFDAGQAGNAHFFAMEFVEGIDLARHVKESGPLSVVAACDYVRQAALGLQHAHERGLVHRDIKPANLLLTRSAGAVLGTIKILDMGLARAQGPTEGPGNALTRLGTIIGTPEYLAPEQAINSRVDIRADLYSLGCTFYFLLAGKPPFQGQNINDLLLKHHTEAAPPLERADVPPVVQGILRKLLAKKPEERYQTPADLVAALPAVRKKAENVTADVPVAPVVPAPYGELAAPAFSPRRRGGSDRRRVAVVLACVGVLFLAGIGLAMSLAMSGGNSDGVAQATQAPAATYPFRPRTERATFRAIETRPVETRPEHPPERGGDPAGTWKWTSTFGGGKSWENTLRLRSEGGRLSGVVHWRDEDLPLEGLTFRDGQLAFKVTRERKGMKFTASYHGTVSGDTIRGKIDFGNERTVDWEAKRSKD